ncbi:benzoate/H(+) symporter BenE family transporter [Acinetobacter nosocomialis]|uniref:benzoate/H(+) symporter BenE family transporter n=1 Tax=Acinetobacter nosocomialis TaxID=106654 RepID=UPI001B839B86|nr:benzoate/H(+) symporter BenE family transporter [Acinetobacter nosocomialis]MBR7685262.1 benzoate/H(+) symporter BenE [Acinetobacter nosocomialis]MBR7700173.1 benzoate/H(+) symporter BenE [Acinetobacter nosocomialis]MBR7758922.1 benzoate/H(+) symporter BenE [Acinetobacter nosocomialis]MDE1707282.1 benzoate/H(+) symporter BenE [Acinetobacter nosocomialis]HDG9766478.1 benzoate/H(+) symporter BenE [Acinetobacter nosocomialis]
MATLFKTLKNDWSISATVAGFLAVLISYSGPLIIFFQAAQRAHVSTDMMVSWIWGISIGAAVSGIYLSIKYKTPVITAWSAPGTALLVTLFPNISLNEAVAAYITSAIVIFLIGVTGYFDKLLKWIPQDVAAGMMAGILFQFGIGLFTASDSMPFIVFSMLIVFLIAKRLMPRYTMIWVLAAGVLLSLILGKMNPVDVSFSLAIPQWISPEWTWNSTLNLAVPLILVSLTGQFLPGMAIMKLSGYDTPAKPIITATSIASLAVACVGGITIVLASITAALCMGKDAHELKEKRYIAGITNGIFYILGGLFAGSIVMLFSLLPKELVAALAGLALLGAIATNISVAMKNDGQRDAALITFLATASGMHFLGLSSVFWGICIGVIAHFILTPRSTSATN